MTDPAGGVLLVTGHPEDQADPGPVELWRWDGEKWTEIEPDSERPSARNFAGVAMDTGRGLLLHGGLTRAGASDEKWVWDGKILVAGPHPRPRRTWRPVGPVDGVRRGFPAGPVVRRRRRDQSVRGHLGLGTRRLGARRGRRANPVRWPAFLEQDKVSGSGVLYGGHQIVDEDAPPALADTWVWARDRWRAVRGAVQPGPLLNANGVAHPEHGLLLIGGGNGAGEDNGRVWRWSGASWQLLHDGVLPLRQAFGVTYDEERGVVVLTGGLVEPGSTERHQDVWEWAGDPARPAVRVSPDE